MKKSISHRSLGKCCVNVQNLSNKQIIIISLMVMAPALYQNVNGAGSSYYAQYDKKMMEKEILDFVDGRRREKICSSILESGMAIYIFVTYNLWYFLALNLPPLMTNDGDYREKLNIFSGFHSPVSNDRSDSDLSSTLLADEKENSIRGHCIEY